MPPRLTIVAMAMAMLLPSLGAAASKSTEIRRYQWTPGEPVLSNVALTAESATRTTAEIPIAGYSQVTAYIEYTRGATGAATHLTLMCWAGYASGKLGQLVVLSESSTPGTSDSVGHTWRQAVSASTTIRWVITPLNDVLLQCRVGSEGAVTADDVITRIDYRLGVL